MYLLHALFALKDELQISISLCIWITVFVGGRPKKDMAFVKKICQKLSVPLMTEQVDTKAMAMQYGWSLEQAARTGCVMTFSERTDKEVALDKIALAHHMGDQAETLLLNLVRGCGMQGLLGMQPFRPPLYIRPMLGLEKTPDNGGIKSGENCLSYRQNQSRHRIFAQPDSAPRFAGA